MSAETKCIRIRLTSWTKFFELLPAIVGRNWIYRGHENAEWSLSTGLERNEREIDSYVDRKWDDKGMTGELKRVFNVALRAGTQSRVEFDTEKMAIEYFRMMANEKLKPNSSYVEALALMQHYGCKTRLLDFTFSIFIALFFAYEKRFCGKDRAIWMINLGEMLKNEKGKIYEDIRKNEDATLSKEDQDLMAMYPRQVLMRCADMADKWLLEQCHDEFGVCPVWLPGNNPRVVAQSGLFLMPKSQRGSFIENLSKELAIKITEDKKDFEYEDVEFGKYVLDGSAVVKLVFDSGLEEHAWDVLEMVNITPGVVYPDLEGLAKSIQYRSGVS